MSCGDPAHEWLVTLRSVLTVEIHAESEESAKEIAEENASNGCYEDLGNLAEAIEAWQEEAE
jgi:tRNA/tmRNA/rRNA uracil-C5-methylase (TrmA/RlmC/RlmD family)